MEHYVYYSEEEMLYDSKYKGHFNKRLADWAIENMTKKNVATGALEPVKKKTIDEYDTFLKANNLKLKEESYYDGYYLLHMAIADYPKSIEDDKHRAAFIEETICDPDGEPTSVLACFKAKMEEAGKPIFWELFM